MSLSDVQHFATMVSGCESINQMQYNTPEATYAQTVLKLHANDAGLYAGQEGFLDAVKKGAGKVKEWVAKLVVAVKNFLTGKKKDAKELETEFKDLNAKAKTAVKAEAPKEEKKEESPKKTDNAFAFMDAPAIAVHKSLASFHLGLQGMENVLSDEAFEKIGYKPALGDAINAARKAEEYSTEEKANALEVGLAISRIMTALAIECDNLNNKLSAYAANVNVKDEEKNAVANKVSSALNKFGAGIAEIEKIAKTLKDKQVAALNKAMTE